MVLASHNAINLSVHGYLGQVEIKDGISVQHHGAGGIRSCTAGGCSHSSPTTVGVNPVHIIVDHIQVNLMRIVILSAIMVEYMHHSGVLVQMNITQNAASKVSLNIMYFIPIEY